MPFDVVLHRHRLDSSIWAVSDRSLLTDRRVSPAILPTITEAEDQFPAEEWEIVPAFLTPWDATWRMNPTNPAVWMDKFFAGWVSAFIGVRHRSWVRLSEGTLFHNRFLSKESRSLPDPGLAIAPLYFLRQKMEHSSIMVSLVNYTTTPQTMRIVTPDQWEVLAVRQPQATPPSPTHESPQEFTLPVSNYIINRRLGHIFFSYDELVVNFFLRELGNAFTGVP